MYMYVVSHTQTGLSLGFKPNGHVTLSPAALRVEYKCLGVKHFLNKIFSSIFTLYLI
jgi:hypothetical protein